MDNIFDGVPHKKPDKATLKQEIEKLRSEGKSWRECETILKTPQTTLRRVCQGVPESPQSVPNTVPRCAIRADPDVLSASQSLDNDYVTRKEVNVILEEFKALVERTIEERANTAIRYFITNKLENACINQIRALKREANERG